MPVGELVFQAPTSARYGLDVTIGEVARGDHIWIPSQDNILLETKYAPSNNYISQAGRSIRSPGGVEGYALSSQGGDVRVVIEDFRITSPVPERRIVNPSGWPSATDTNQVLIQVLLFQLGGKAIIMPEEIHAVEGRGILKTVIQDPNSWKVELV